MEGDDEWEDHLIVSYTPPQGCEHTLRTEQLDRIVQHTKLELLQILDKHKSFSILDDTSEMMPAHILQRIEQLTSVDLLHEKHKYWNFICRNRRNGQQSLIAAVGSHVFHQDDRGEWSMFAEPGDKGYTGDIRFVLQWKQFDFVFTNLAQVAVYQDGKFVKRLAHKYAGNSSFGVQGSPRFVYFLDNDKLHRVDERLESEKYHPEAWTAHGELVNFDISRSDELALLFKNSMLVGPEGNTKTYKLKQSVHGGSIRFVSLDRLLVVARATNDSGNQAILFSRDLEVKNILELKDDTVTMNKMRLVKKPSWPTFVLLNPGTSVLLLAVTESKVFFVARQDTKDDSYTFACLGDRAMITGGFSKLFCLRIVPPKLKSD